LGLVLACGGSEEPPAAPLPTTSATPQPPVVPPTPRSDSGHDATQAQAAVPDTMLATATRPPIAQPRTTKPWHRHISVPGSFVADFPKPPDTAAIPRGAAPEAPKDAAARFTEDGENYVVTWRDLDDKNLAKKASNIPTLFAPDRARLIAEHGGELRSKRATRLGPHPGMDYVVLGGSHPVQIRQLQVGPRRYTLIADTPDETHAERFLASFALTESAPAPLLDPWHSYLSLDGRFEIETSDYQPDVVASDLARRYIFDLPEPAIGCRVDTIVINPDQAKTTLDSFAARAAEFPSTLLVNAKAAGPPKATKVAGRAGFEINFSGNLPAEAGGAAATGTLRLTTYSSRLFAIAATTRKGGEEAAKRCLDSFGPWMANLNGAQARRATRRCNVGRVTACKTLALVALDAFESEPAEVNLIKACRLADGPACGRLAALLTDNAEDMDSALLQRIEKLLTLGCRLEDGASCFSLADNFAPGTTPAAKAAASLQLMERACEFGFAEGCQLAGQRLRTDKRAADALTLFGRGCAHGIHEACLQAADLLTVGGAGVTADPDRGIAIVERLCKEAGHRRACLILEGPASP
ncbi:MAG: TPR repeat protein, partial [Myxococcota bacterium]